MSLLPALLTALVPLFALILTGYGLRRWANTIQDHHVPVMNGLVMNVTLPATIFVAIASAPAISASYAMLPVLLIVVQLAAVAISYGLGRMLRLPSATMGMILVTGAFGNTAFLGYPVILALMPRMFPAGVLLDEFGMTILMYVGTAIVALRYGAEQGENGTSPWLALAKFLRGVIFLSIVAGLVAHTIRGHLPGWTHPITSTALQVMSYLGQATTPLVLLSLGASLRPREAASPLVLVPSAMKLVVVPVLMWGLFFCFGLPRELVGIAVLQASMPTSVIVSVLCERHGMDGARAGGVVCASTALSILTIPVMLTLLR